MMKNNGGVAQLGEQLLCTQQVVGSMPIASTKQHWCNSIGLEYLPTKELVVGSSPTTSAKTLAGE